MHWGFGLTVPKIDRTIAGNHESLLVFLKEQLIYKPVLLYCNESLKSFFAGYLDFLNVETTSDS